ncbi:carbohydrate kinase family protein [Opitutus terrae]|uniref:PfkB domain protein n=1 Tax=Opitutus terrae (strain DSM 11246 / JCM 15787 / PB90-1) TaxID=452637 RepID=B2A024_OPITP|nr:PfkB family carbohydrate kinase [Opitutus terrae]ACB77360.1 PfkB domain protein [Opitutus terrae PB90-1]
MTLPTASNSARSGVLAGGNWLVDHVKILNCWPAQDALARIESETWDNGGAPYNVLKDLARMGATFPLSGIGLVGDDADGERILADCRQHRIDTRQLRKIADTPTAYCDVMTERATGRRTFFYQRGANARLAPEHFDFRTTNAKIFHLGYLLLLDALDEPVDGRPHATEVFRQAHSAGLLTSLDCVSEASARFESVVKPVLPEVDVLFANDFEAEKLTGIALHDGGVIRRAAVERAAQALLGFGVRQWVILHFPTAVFAASAAGECCWQPSVRVPSEAIRGAAGAGDALAAGVLYGLHENADIAAALRLGVAVAASSLFDATCSNGVRPVSECLQLAERFGFQPLPQ